MKVVGVVGLPASGKGEFSRIARECGIPVVVMGDVIRQIAREEGLPETDGSLGAVASRLRQDQGLAAVASRCLPVIERTRGALIVVDGIRGEAEVGLFRRHFRDFVLVGIEAPFEQRLARLSTRNRSDATHRVEELRARDEREMGWGLGKALAGAEIRVKNEGGLPEFEKQVQDLLTRLAGGR
jgi:dephospho-CoA kinase